jgi:ABC-type nitrate/sulfonate/bicarbonate transport system substrate-binding protein
MDRRTFVKSIAGIGLCGASASFDGVLTAAMAQSAMRIDAVSLSANTNRLFDELLVSQGFLEKFGVAPNTIAVADGTKVMAALLSGNAGLCMQVGFASVIPAILAGAKLKVVAVAEALPEVAVYSANPDIQSVSDLAGKTVGIGPPGALLHLLMVTLLRKKGVDPAKVRFVNIGSGSDVFKATVSGKVDAGPGDLAFYNNPGKYGAHALRDGATWIEIPEFTNQVSLATDVAIEQQGDAITRMLAAYRTFYKFLHSPASQEPFLRAFLKVVNSNEEEATTQWEHYQKYHPFAEDLVLGEGKVKYMQDLNILLGTQANPIDYDHIVNTSLAQEAIKLTG